MRRKKLKLRHQTSSPKRAKVAPPIHLLMRNYFTIKKTLLQRINSIVTKHNMVAIVSQKTF